MIRFINHASFVVKAGAVSLLCDPWIKGSVFHNGWNLLAEQQHPGLEGVDYIWFSHEHPDHFSVPFLRSIPVKRRSTITVLYQQTSDRRVRSFCERLGFKVRELAQAEPVQLGKDLRVICGKVPFYDSWLLIETSDSRILNTNDCIFETSSQFGSIKPHVPDCDILFTQFSYANWPDSRDNRQARRDFAAEKLRRLALQCEIFRPKFVVPFASFFYFSHVENAAMNTDVTRPSDAVRFIEENCRAIPVLLIPNEYWDGVTPRDNRPAMDWWEAAYFDAMAREKNLPGESVFFVDMCVKADAAIRRVKQRNNFALVTGLQRLGLIKTVDFYLTDTEQSMSFDWIAGLRLLDSPPFRAIEMHSETLAFIFDNDFGVDTVNSNARFECSIRDKKRMIGLFSVLELNNIGRSLTFSDSLKFVNPALVEQGLRTIGVLRG